jgi:hypothetical protein
MLGFSSSGHTRLPPMAIYIHKCKIKTTQDLLAYRIVEENLELIMIGPHQNYYRDLKKYIKST